MSTPLTVTAKTAGGSGTALFTRADTTHPVTNFIGQSGAIVLEAGLYPLGPDFAWPTNDPVYAAYLGTGVTSVTGAGKDITVLAPPANSMGAAALAKARATSGTNPVRILRTDRAALSNLTVKGNPQSGANFGGIQTYQGTSGVTHTNVAVRASVGSGSAPPFETFAWDVTRTNDLRFVNVDLDGLDDTGKKVSGSLLGLNSVAGFTATGGKWTNAAYGASATSYRGTGNLTYTGVTATGSLVPFNFEQNVATILLDRCDMTGSYPGVNGAHVICDSLLGSSKVTIKDPKFDGSHLVVRVHANYTDILDGTKGPNAQLRSDITLTVAGVPRPDLLAFI